MFFCSNMLARDFVDQCDTRLHDLDFDLRCSSLALGVWASSPEHTRPVLDALRELADERQRHRDTLVRLRERLFALSNREALHHHLDIPIGELRQQVRRTLFPDASGPESDRPAGPKLLGNK